MLPAFAIVLLMSGMVLVVDEPKFATLAAPADWGGETIKLPPGFAPDMKLQGFESIRFAPGMMKPGSDTFFSYAFVFQLQPKPTLTQVVVKEEFLKYYRGLCRTVLNGKLPDVDPSEFEFELRQVNEKTADMSTSYVGTLDWIEPFATKKPQKLNLEIRTWTKDDHNYLFACVSPQVRDTAIWKQLRTIRENYLAGAGRRSKKHSVIAKPLSIP